MAQVDSGAPPVYKYRRMPRAFVRLDVEMCWSLYFKDYFTVGCVVGVFMITGLAIKDGQNIIKSSARSAATVAGNREI